MVMKNKFDLFFSKREFFLPLILFALFLAASLPGITWGAPALWNPDELVWRVDMALNGAMQFDVTEPDYNYPSLPKQVMYLIGSITYGLGRSSFAFIVAARSFSSILGAVVAVLVYRISRLIGANKRISLLAGLLYIVSGVAAANGRFAHNDLYLQSFSVLCLYSVIRFQYSQKTIWLLVSFLSVGMAASSKYTGASLVLLPVGVIVLMNWKTLLHNWLVWFGVLMAGGILVILGYGIGTPRILIAPVEYLSKAVPAAIRFSTYGFGSGTPTGLYGQWAVFHEAVGGFAYYLFLAAFAWFVVCLFAHRLGRLAMEEARIPGLLILLINIIIFDLPFLVSINYIPRHFIPFVPVFAVLAAFFVDDILRFASDLKLGFPQKIVFFSLTVGITYSALRLASISLLFMNDARIPASDYIDGIRGYGKSIEYTLYPPIVDKKRFMRAHNYPIYFVKYEDDSVPTGGRIKYNQGEEGLLERRTDYFVIDSYTYGRFYSDSECAINAVECDFFKRLLAGETTSYHLVADFSYRLPKYLPQLTIASVNPDIKIYELTP